MITPEEISRVVGYLRRLFNNERINIKPPSKPNAPVEIYIGDEFIGVLHRDEDEGEVSYDVNMSILEEDL